MARWLMPLFVTLVTAGPVPAQDPFGGFAVLINQTEDPIYLFDAEGNQIPPLPPVTPLGLLDKENANPMGLHCDVGPDGLQFYVLDSLDKQVYLYDDELTLLDVSKTLLRQDGSGIGQTEAIAIDGDEMWLLHKDRLLQYSLSAAFSSTGTLNAVQEIPIAAQLPTGLAIDNTFLYVLQDLGGSKDRFDRYRRDGTEGPVPSKALLTKEPVGVRENSSLDKPSGAAICGDTIWVVDPFQRDEAHVLKRVFGYDLPALFAGTTNKTQKAFTEFVIETGPVHDWPQGLCIICDPIVNLEKTVYCGQDNGQSCPGNDLVQGQVDSPITYCFEVTNEGATYLDQITITDADLGITEADMTLVSGSTPLAPSSNLVYIFETTIGGDLVNEAKVVANPTTMDGTDIAGLDDVMDQDTAEVDEVQPAIRIFKDPAIQQIPEGTDASFSITVTNIGDVALSNVQVLDPRAPECDMFIGDLGVGEAVTYVCEARNVMESFCNAAEVCGAGPCGNVVCDVDEADVVVIEVADADAPPGSSAKISEGCTRSLEEWLAYPATWPLTRINIGGVIFSQGRAIDLMHTDAAGDVVTALSQQVLVALLNAFNGAHITLPLADMQAAQDWLAQYGQGAEPPSESLEDAASLLGTLQDFNSGLMGPGPCYPSTVRDFDVDLVTDPGLFYASSGLWSLVMSSLGPVEKRFGFADTVAVPADYDGDGETDIAVYYPVKGEWYLMKSTEGFEVHQFGFAGTTPVVFDYDHDGKADLGVYHPPSGMWYFMKSADGFETRQFGFAGTAAVPGDYDQDGVGDLAVYHDASGTWYLFKSTEGFESIQFGYAGTTPVAADFDGDGETDLGLYDPAIGQWYHFNSTEGFSTRGFGYPGTVPVSGDYDGDGKADIGVCDPAIGILYLMKTLEGFTTHAFDPGGGVPLGLHP